MKTWSKLEKQLKKVLGQGSFDVEIDGGDSISESAAMLLRVFMKTQQNGAAFISYEAYAGELHLRNRADAWLNMDRDICRLFCLTVNIRGENGVDSFRVFQAIRTRRNFVDVLFSQEFQERLWPTKGQNREHHSLTASDLRRLVEPTEPTGHSTHQRNRPHGSE